MQFRYSAFGLRFGSNRDLPGLLPLCDSSGQNLQIWLGAGPWTAGVPAPAAQAIWYISSYRNDAGEPCLKISKVNGGAYFRFDYHDGTCFTIDRAGTEVWATW